MSTHWQELDRIFTEARQMPAGDQADFIARACGSNAALYSDAQSLLSASTATGNFMAAPALERLSQLFAGDGLNLKPGMRVGAYTIVRQLGFGGAGEVWRAKDERLGRDVAIKVLLPHLSTDGEKLRRFAEEARAAGTLNHPNILTVHDVGEHDGLPYLVSECLEGRNLRERLNAGPIPQSEAVAVSLGITHGLAAAHERGIVHRDLKPENTFLKSDGGVKVLDFGLAKLKLPTEGPKPGQDETAMGVIAGTAGYMSPEQARGEPADPRSDLFALGVMMYEMLAGRHPFRGASVFETLHAILTRDPEDLVTVNEKVPLPLARIVMRLLEKAPDARFQSARDLAWSLAQATSAAALPASDKQQKASRKFGWQWLGVPVALAAMLAVGWWLAGQRSPPPSQPQLTRFTWTLPAGAGLDSAPIVAPDGRHITFTATDATGIRLFVRDLESLEARVIAGTDDAMLPFWSPDSHSVAFFNDGGLMKVLLPNGAPTRVAAAPAGRGGTWARSGIIVFAPDLVLAGLSRVSADGGEVEPATLLDISRSETAHLWPVALPDGKHFLYFVRSIDPAHRGIYLARVDGPAARAGTRLFQADSGAVYVPRAGSGDGDLFYFSGGRIEVRRFDNATLTASADARAVDFLSGEHSLANPILVSASKHVMAFSNVPVPGGNRLASVGMTGEGLRVWEKPDQQNWPRVSPDGKRLARQHMDETRSQPDIWVEDLERGTVFPVARTLSPDISPVWSPDGSQLAFVTGHLPGRQGELKLTIAAADGTGILQTLPCPSDYCEPTDWSTDGTSLLVNALQDGNANVWLVPIAKGGEAKPLLTAEFAESDARFSPDGKWVAYVSREGGRPEVSVRGISGPPRRMVISGEGGTQPVWKRDGKLLYFVDLGGQLRSVDVRWATDGTPIFGLPERLNVPLIGFGHWGTQYDVTPDGSRMYFMRRNEDPGPREIQVVIDWAALLD